jgi:hypothetical protein
MFEEAERVMVSCADQYLYLAGFPDAVGFVRFVNA